MKCPEWYLVWFEKTPTLDMIPGHETNLQWISATTFCNATGHLWSVIGSQHESKWSIDLCFQQKPVAWKQQGWQPHLAVWGRPVWQPGKHQSQPWVWWGLAVNITSKLLSYCVSFSNVKTLFLQNHRQVKTLIIYCATLDFFRLNFQGYPHHNAVLMFWLGFRHTNHLVRVWKTYWFGFIWGLSQGLVKTCRIFAKKTSDCLQMSQRRLVLDSLAWQPCCLEL